MTIKDILVHVDTSLTCPDLIAMSAYGHSRLREAMLGGMTRDMLRRMTVPALMSH
jgi:nucleotide-binding universal stress UspA family protein